MFGKISVKAFIVLGLFAAVAASAASSTTVLAACAGTTPNTDYARSMTSFRDNCTNIAPSFVRNSLYSAYYDADFGVMYEAWISPAGAPAATSYTADYGDTTAPLQLNVVSYRKRDNDRQSFRRHILASNIASLRGDYIDVAYPGSPGEYRIMRPVPITLPLNPSITADTIYYVTTDQKAVNNLTGGRYACVTMYTGDPNGGDPVSSLNDYSSCTLGDSRFPILIKVRPYWIGADFVNIYQTNPATGAITSGPLGTDVNNAAPGQRYTFNYTVRNNGPSPTNATVTSQRTYTYPTASSGWVNYQTRAAGVADNANIFNGSMGNTGVIPASAVGSSYCLTMRFSPLSSVNAGYNTSPQMCVRVPFNYNLTPSLSAASSSVSQGEPITFSHSMANSGPTTSTAVSYSVKQFIIPPGGPFNSSVGVVDNAPGTGAPYGSAVVPSSATITPNKAFPVGTTAAPEADGLLPVSTTGMAPGTRVCRIFAVDPATGLAPQVRNRWSAPACVVIGKQPYVTIKNGDAFAGGSFQKVAATSTCPATGVYAGGFSGTNSTFGASGTYGSFGEYQLLAVGTVSTFGSAGKPQSTNLTYQPAPAGRYFAATTGVAQTRRCMGDITEHVATTGGTNLGATSTLNISTANGIYTRTGSLTLTSAGAIPAGRHITIVVNGDVIINGNIAFSAQNGGSNYTDLGSLPSVIIAATGNISVAQGVTRIDGIYQSYGRFVSCLEGQSAPNNVGIGTAANVCNQQLTVNGAVSATKFVLRRIVGGDGNNAVLRNTPSEQFIYRPDIVLSAYANSRASSYIQTDAERELPARY